jgi:hypothetical protein
MHNYMKMIADGSIFMLNLVLAISTFIIGQEHNVI